MKNIVIVTSYLSGNGGIEKVIGRMLDILPKEKYKFQVISLTGGDKVNRVEREVIAYTGKENWLKDIPNKRLPIGSRNKIINFISHSFFSAFYLMKIKPDLVICTGPSQPVFLRKVREYFRLKYKIFIWPHFSLDSGFGNFENIKKADKLLAISKGIIEQAVSIGVERSDIEYFPNPFRNMHDEINLDLSDNNKVRFGYVGRLLYLGQKRIKDIIDAAVLVSGDFEVVIVGDGEDYDIISDYIISNQLDDKITILRGWHSDPWSVIGDIDALVLSSQFEGLPTVLGEAMSRGISCISSECNTGPADFIKNNENGFLYKIGDVDELRKLMQMYVDKRVNFNKIDINNSINDLYDATYIERFQRIIDEA